MSLQRTLALISGRSQDEAVLVSDVCLDSRKITRDDVFFAVAKDPQLARQHIFQAIDAGAAAIVVDRQQFQNQLRAVESDIAVPIILIDDLRAGLGKIADVFYQKPSSRVAIIGITGTNGKTSCSHWIAQAWSRLNGRAAMLGTLGCEVFIEGTPDSGLCHETGLTTADVLSNHRLLDELCGHGVSAVAMEVSSHALDQGRVDGVAFDTAIFTNLSRDHLDYHGDMVAYGRAKRLLFERPELKLALMNSDDSFGVELQRAMKEINSSARLLTYALKDSSADIGVERCEATGEGIVAEVRTPWGKGVLQSKYPGGFNLLNVLAVVGTLCGHGMDLQSVLGVVGQLQAVPGRTQIVSAGADDVLVIVDYAHTPDALGKVLEAVRERCVGQLWCVFGCGGNRDQGKRPQMGSAASSYADRVVVTSDNPRHEDPVMIMDAILKGCNPVGVEIEVDRKKAIYHAINMAAAGDAVVIAGKGHETYQEIANKRYPFSDAGTALDALHVRRQKMAGVVMS